ncbi:haloacid dehalogenase, type II [Polytolypa hystricis UAMH7299]|uniref:Haloacid dehalogenase, type II n=1 Tax=Polytolypa hystricis (strain UAMH7299) TaxID=1447883 RepID=A0A2B7WYB2_POLH7|nr:haloacid dehalogenase, type II [Polytolypa hystricis UAMH7299]
MTTQHQQQKRPLTSFTLISLDIYGTLINWESGIFTGLQPLTSRLPPSHPLKSDLSSVGAAFAAHERTIQAQTPDLTYDRVLKGAYEGLARELDALPTPPPPPPPAATAARDGEHGQASSAEEVLLDAESTTFAESISVWPAFADTISALRALKKRFKLVPLSNVDRTSFEKTLRGGLAGLHDDDGQQQKPFFDAVYTAQNIGSYKPSLRNFEFLIENVKREFGVEKEDVLHVAQSLFHDHEPAMKVGLESVWIARGQDGGKKTMGGDVEEFLGTGGGGGGEGEEGKKRVGFGWRFATLAELVQAVEREEEEELKMKG